MLTILLLVATLLTNQPARGSSKSITVLIIVIICVLCLAVVIGIVICGTRSKKWPACINANKAFAKKRPKKKRFGVKMETTFSEINPNGTFFGFSAAIGRRFVIEKDLNQVLLH